MYVCQHAKSVPADYNACPACAFNHKVRDASLLIVQAPADQNLSVWKNSQVADVVG